MIVYTAIFGKYDELREPLVKTPGVRYICFTDQHLNSKTWELVHLNLKRDPCRNAREVKICFHKFMPHFKGLAMWVDANQQIATDLTFLFSMATKPLTLLTHPDRKCIYEEAQACIDLKKDSQDIIAAQMMRYKSAEYPKDNGLVATGVMIRKNDDDLNFFCEMWFNEIINGSRRDQLSFNFVFWDLVEPFEYDLIPWHMLRENFNRWHHTK